ncbi:MAG: L-lactate permease, partial [Gemmatimonadota bacterium]
MPWTQRYDPLGSVPLSTALALLPVLVLLGLLASHRVRAHQAALAGLLTALGVAVVGVGMPAGLAGRAALFGAAYGLFPIGW